MTKSALVLGASGRFGRNAATALESAGWTVRRFDRQSDRLPEAADGVDLIVNGWNPPYDQWAAELPRQTDEVIAAARKAGATILMPGNVYVYGTGSPQALTLETPHNATNPLGRIRIDCEARYRDSGVPVILLRAGDFLDDAPSGNWFDRILTKNTTKGVFSYPGRADVAHSWAFLPDMAAVAVALAERRAELATFEEVLFPGYTLTGQELCELCGQALGKSLQLKPMSWLPLQIARPFWPMAKNLLEMRYLWDMPHGLVNDQLASLAPGVAQTPVLDALRSALQHQIDPN